MIREFSIIYYEPDPFLGERFALGAVLYSGATSEIFVTSHVPGEHCLGSPARAAVMKSLVSSLREVPGGSHLPTVLGSAVDVGPRRVVPVGVRDAASWIRWVVDERRREPPHHSRASSRAPALKRLGRSFFETFDCTRYVHDGFDPQTSLNGSLQAARAFGIVSHYAGGARRVLLLEPLSPNRSDWQGDVQRAALRLKSYQSAAPQFDVPVEVGAFVLEGGRDEVREEMFHRLEDVGIPTTDTSNRAARNDLLGKIEGYAQAGATP